MVRARSNSCGQARRRRQHPGLPGSRPGRRATGSPASLGAGASTRSSPTGHNSRHGSWPRSMASSSHGRTEAGNPLNRSTYSTLSDPATLTVTPTEAAQREVAARIAAAASINAVPQIDLHPHGPAERCTRPHGTRRTPDRICAGQRAFWLLVAGLGFEPRLAKPTALQTGRQHALTCSTGPMATAWARIGHRRGLARGLLFRSSERDLLTMGHRVMPLTWPVVVAWGDLGAH